jgi:ABC-type uncharacterized transport system substrate-binding protein
VTYQVPTLTRRTGRSTHLTYGVDFEEAFARGTVFVDKILRGAKPATLPVEQPTKFRLAINLWSVPGIP